MKESGARIQEKGEEELKPETGEQQQTLGTLGTLAHFRHSLWARS
jgi:hypothetical protein